MSTTELVGLKAAAPTKPTRVGCPLWQLTTNRLGIRNCLNTGALPILNQDQLPMQRACLLAGEPSRPHPPQLPAQSSKDPMVSEILTGSVDPPTSLSWTVTMSATWLVSSTEVALLNCTRSGRTRSRNRTNQLGHRG